MLEKNTGNSFRKKEGRQIFLSVKRCLNQKQKLEGFSQLKDLNSFKSLVYLILLKMIEFQIIETFID